VIDDDASGNGVRLDVWLDVACLFKTRSEAQKACKAGRIEVNGQPAKPHRLVRAGDDVEIGRSFGRKQQLRIAAVTERRVRKSDARSLYEDLTPPPTPEEVAAKRAERLYRAAVTPPRAPDKRERRALRRLRGRD